MAYDETKHKRGTGEQGGQFVSSSGTKSARIGFDGKRGAGYGDKDGNADVKSLQQALNKLGMTDAAGKPLAVDGKFGPKTTAAVRRLQRKLGVPVNGKVTVALLKRIQGLKRRTSLVDPTAKKVAPKKAVPAKKVAPPAQHYAGSRTVKRHVGYSRLMTDYLARHGTHNQKSHGNRLGKPDNIGGKTGLAKATSALADRPVQGPEIAPKHRDFSAAEIRDILAPGGHAFTGVSRKNSDHLKMLEDAGASPDQARQILKDLHGNPDRDWETTDVGYAVHHRAEAEGRAKAEAERRVELIAATPAAYARLLGTDGKPALVKSKAVAGVFESMQANGWQLTGATGHGGYTFSSPDGARKIQVLAIRGVNIYDERHNKISGVKALAYIGGA